MQLRKKKRWKLTSSRSLQRSGPGSLTAGLFVVRRFSQNNGVLPADSCCFYGPGRGVLWRQPLPRSLVPQRNTERGSLPGQRSGIRGRTLVLFVLHCAVCCLKLSKQLLQSAPLWVNQRGIAYTATSNTRSSFPGLRHFTLTSNIFVTILHSLHPLRNIPKHPGVLITTVSSATGQF